MDKLDFLDGLTDAEVFGVSVINLVLALAVSLVVYLALTVALKLVLSRLQRISDRTTNRADDVIVEVLGGTNGWLIALVALLVGVGMLDLPDRRAARQAGAGVQTTSAAATLISRGVRTLLWTIVLLAMLSNLGVNITAFIASLGVGGIAVALAVQNVLGDLFASVAIAVDKPFEVGDFIVFGSVAGTVELVGVKTTRIRSLGGEQIVMSNTELLKQTVSNYKRLRERRIVFGFRVTYATTPEQAEQVPAVVRRIVEQSDKLRFDRAHLKGFGENALEYEVVYIVQAPDFNVYMDEQQRINFALMRELAGLGVTFAVPTRSLFVNRSDDDVPDAKPQLV